MGFTQLFWFNNLIKRYLNLKYSSNCLNSFNILQSFVNDQKPF